MKFELKLNTLEEERLTEVCWLEKIELGEKDNYSSQRKGLYNNLGWSTIEVENMIRLEKNLREDVEGREKDIESQILEGKIRESRYNKRYKNIMTKGLPKCLKRWDNEKRINTSKIQMWTF